MFEVNKSRSRASNARYNASHRRPTKQVKRVHYVDADRSNAGLKGAINNPHVSWKGARRAKKDLKHNGVPKREIPSRSLKTMIKRLGVKLKISRRRH